MRKFLLKSLVFVSFFTFLAFILQPYIDSGLKQTNCSPNYKVWNDIYESKINADLIIQGSSRARMNISPKYLDSVFNFNSYNLGMDGYTFPMQYYRFLIYMKHNKKPKYIIQVDPFLTFTKRELYDYKQFIPYLDDKLIREALTNYDGLGNKDFYIPLYKYLQDQGMFFSALKSLKGDCFPPNTYYKGFESVHEKWNTSFSFFKKTNPNGYPNKIDTTTLRLVDNFVLYCIKENIKLIFINPPIYYEANKIILNQNVIQSIYNAYSNKYNIPYIDYSNDSICMDTINFNSFPHLNDAGTIKFNKKLSADLKTILQD